jgi:polyisoprenoid-binding protein YceI
MTRIVRLVSSLAVVFALASPIIVARSERGSAASPAWTIDRAHSRITFTVTKWGFAEVEGRFLDFTGELYYNPSHVEQSRVSWRVPIASVETGESNRDKSLLAPEYFDAAHFPAMTFESASVRPTGDDAFDVTGTLTIRGLAKPLTTRVQSLGQHDAPGEGTFRMFQTEFVIDRYDFQIVGGSILGPAISRDVHVKVLAAARAPAQGW